MGVNRGIASIFSWHRAVRRRKIQGITRTLILNTPARDLFVCRATHRAIPRVVHVAGLGGAFESLSALVCCRLLGRARTEADIKSGTPTRARPMVLRDRRSVCARGGDVGAAETATG